MSANDFFSSEENYEYCPHCNRKFFVGRLKLHLKSCKEGNTFKPVKPKANRIEPLEKKTNEPQMKLDIDAQTPESTNQNVTRYRSYFSSLQASAENLHIKESSHEENENIQENDNQSGRPTHQDEEKAAENDLANKYLDEVYQYLLF